MKWVYLNQSNFIIKSFKDMHSDCRLYDGYWWWPHLQDNYQLHHLNIMHEMLKNISHIDHNFLILGSQSTKLQRLSIVTCGCIVKKTKGCFIWSITLNGCCISSRNDIDRLLTRHEQYKYNCKWYTTSIIPAFFGILLKMV